MYIGDDSLSLVEFLEWLGLLRVRFLVFVFFFG